MNVEAIIGGVVAFGVLIAGAGYGYGKFREGKARVNKENEDAQGEALDSNTATLKLLMAQIKALQDSRNEQDGKIQDLTAEVHGLKALIEEKDKKLQEYILILQNRNPLFDQFVTKSEKFMEDISHSVNHIKSVTDELKGCMAPQKA